MFRNEVPFVMIRRSAILIETELCDKSWTLAYIPTAVAHYNPSKSSC